MLCDYGCDKEAKYKLKSGKWCCEKFWQRCSSIRKKNSEAKLGENSAWFGKFHSNETKKKISEGNKGKIMSLEAREKISINHTNISGKNNPMYGKKHSRKSKQEMSRSHKKLFLNPEFCKKFSEQFQTKPNKLEKIMIDILNKNFPEQYEYVGNYKFWIEGQNPDFVDRENKKIIEVFGDYWHGKEFTGKDPEKNEKEKVENFKKHGYRTLIIWEHELSNIVKIVNKINSI